MTPNARANYERQKARRIEEIHALAQCHMDQFEALMREIDAIEAETFADAMADDRSKEYREYREELRKLEGDGDG